jgi:hypothetical protein
MEDLSSQRCPRCRTVTFISPISSLSLTSRRIPIHHTAPWTSAWAALTDTIFDHSHESVDMHTEISRSANSDDTLTASCIAVTVSACILVVVSVCLRYLGRWVLQKRQASGKGRGIGRIYGLDDGELSCLWQQCGTASYSDSVQHTIAASLLWPCDGSVHCYTERNGRPFRDY